MPTASLSAAHSKKLEEKKKKKEEKKKKKEQQKMGERETKDGKGMGKIGREREREKSR